MNDNIFKKFMCGNQVSQVSNPSGEFYNLVATQVPSGKVVLKAYPMTPSNGVELSGMNLGGVKELKLQKCKISPQTMQELSKLNMPALMRLSLNNNELGPMGCKILASSNILSRLTELHLNNNKIKDTGVKELSKVGLDFIEDLSLNENQITADGIKELPGKVSNIECLSLGGNKLNDSAVATINSLNPDNIYFLKLSRNQFSQDGMKKVLDVNKNLDVLLIERNKVKGSKDKYKRKDLFLFY